jgi:Kinesin-associated protein (KAP)
MIAQLFRSTANFPALLAKPGLLQLLARTLREEGKKSMDVAINAIAVFFSLSNFSNLHGYIMDNSVGAMTLELVALELQRTDLRTREQGMSPSDIASKVRPPSDIASQLRAGHVAIRPRGQGAAIGASAAPTRHCHCVAWGMAGCHHVHSCCYAALRRILCHHLLLCSAPSAAAQRALLAGHGGAAGRGDAVEQAETADQCDQEAGPPAVPLLLYAAQPCRGPCRGAPHAQARARAASHAHARAQQRRAPHPCHHVPQKALHLQGEQGPHAQGVSHCVRTLPCALRPAPAHRALHYAPHPRTALQTAHTRTRHSHRVQNCVHRLRTGQSRLHPALRIRLRRSPCCA